VADWAILQTAKHLSREFLALFLNATNAKAKSVEALDASNLDVVDAGRKLSDYLEKSLGENRVAIVHDIGKLDGKVAMSLRPFCDPSDPGVTFPRSVILFTLQNTLDFETEKVIFTIDIFQLKHFVLNLILSHIRMGSQ
jgi:hypothetical protein